MFKASTIICCPGSFHQYRSTRSNWGCSHCGEAQEPYGRTEICWIVCLKAPGLILPSCMVSRLLQYFVWFIFKKECTISIHFQVSKFLWKMGCDSQIRSNWMDTPCPHQARAVQLCWKPKSFEPSFPVYLTGTTEVYWTGCVVLGRWAPVLFLCDLQDGTIPPCPAKKRINFWIHRWSPGQLQTLPYLK